MSNSILTPPAVPNALQLLQVEAKLLATSQQQALLKINQAFNNTLAFIWGDPTKAQERFNAFTSLGYKATDLFVNAAAYSALITVLTGTAPASPIPNGYSVASNVDGTVTVTKTV